MNLVKIMYYYIKKDSGTYTFTTLMEKKLLYVDKTELIWKAYNYETLFLIANRRMGKTFTLSTILAIFSNDENWWRENASKTWIYQNRPKGLKFGMKGVI